MRARRRLRRAPQVWGHMVVMACAVQNKSHWQATSMCSSTFEYFCQRRRQLSLEEIDERILPRSDLDQDDVIVAGLDVAIDSLEMTFQRRTATDELGDCFNSHMLARRREPLGV